jgi:cytochrome c
MRRDRRPAVSSQPRRQPKRWGLALLVVLGVVAGWAGPILPGPQPPPVTEQERAPRPLDTIEPHLRAVVREGQLLWRQPPVAENAIACATCHFTEAEVRAWAASFPKVKPMPSPFTRVVTLQQAVGEAVTKHYRIASGGQNRKLARAITAYLTWAGEGRAITPGVASGQPRLPTRLAALQTSIVRGQDRMERSCARCHSDGTRLSEAAATFPRVPPGGGAVATLEEYLETHAGLAWDSPEAADVAAFLAAHASGRLLQPGGSVIPQGLE